MALYEDAEIRARVRAAWDATFQASGRVINQARTYGFSLMEVIPDPNIHQMLISLRIAESALDIILGSELLCDNHHDTKLLLNARDQLRRLERVAIALKTEDRLMFDSAIAELESQAAF